MANDDHSDKRRIGATSGPCPISEVTNASVATEIDGFLRSKVEADLTRFFSPLARSWRQTLDLELAGLGLSGATGRALLLIDQLGDEVRQTDLAHALDINSASLVRLVDTLADLQYIERLPDQSDRRVRRVRLLGKGREVVGRVERLVAMTRHRTLAGVSDTDLVVALRIARHIGLSLDDRRRA